MEAGVEWKCCNKVETTRLGHSSAVSAASCAGRQGRSRWVEETGQKQWGGGDRAGSTLGYGVNYIRNKERS